MCRSGGRGFGEVCEIVLSCEGPEGGWRVIDGMIVPGLVRDLLSTQGNRTRVDRGRERGVVVDDAFATRQ